MQAKCFSIQQARLAYRPGGIQQSPLNAINAIMPVKHATTKAVQPRFLVQQYHVLIMYGGYLVSVHGSCVGCQESAGECTLTPTVLDTYPTLSRWCTSGASALSNDMHACTCPQNSRVMTYMPPSPLQPSGPKAGHSTPFCSQLG